MGEDPGAGERTLVSESGDMVLNIFEITVHRCVTLDCLRDCLISFSRRFIWLQSVKIVTIVTEIKETMHVRVSRIGAGSEQVLKIVVFKKIFLVSMISLVTIVAMILFIFFFYLFQFSLSYTPANTWHYPAF